MAISHKNGVALTGVSAINGVTSISAINGIAASLGAGGGAEWDPSLYGTPQVWLNGASLVVADGGAVSTWDDSSGAGNDATPDGGATLTMVVSGINGKKSIDCSGDYGLNMPYQATGDYSFFAVAAADASIATNEMFIHLSRDSSKADILARYTGPDYWRLLINPVSWGSGTTAFATTACLWHIRRTADLCEVFRNGTLISDYSHTTTNAGGSSNAYMGHGRIAEIVLYPAARSGSDKTNIESALMTKYAL